MARRLTLAEIDDILAYFDSFFLGLDARARAVKIKALCAPLRAKLSTIEIFPAKIGSLRAEIARAYRFIEPGKSIGIITSQSIGSGQTQMTLNTFHSAGSSTKSATTGVNRFIEIIKTNKSKTQQSKITSVFTQRAENTATLRKYLGALIRHTFSQLVISSDGAELEENYLDAAPKWENFFVKTNDLTDRISGAAVRLEYRLNLELLFRYQITLEEIIGKVAAAAELKDYSYCAAYSPLCEGIICFYLERARDENSFHSALLDLEICGIKGITHAWLTPAAITGAPGPAIEADGSDLARVMQLDFVDTYSTCSTDIWEIFTLFGVEAVRQMILEEFIKIMPDVHIGHLELLADRMTVSGNLRSISRYARKVEDASVISRITFEETLANFLLAAFHEEVDQVDGCSATIVCGRALKTGTGKATLLQTR